MPSFLTAATFVVCIAVLGSLATALRALVADLSQHVDIHSGVVKHIQIGYIKQLRQASLFLYSLLFLCLPLDVSNPSPIPLVVPLLDIHLIQCSRRGGTDRYILD